MVPAGDNGSPVHRGLEHHGHGCAVGMELRPIAVARGAGRRLVRTALHLSARLWTWVVLRESAPERRGRARDRCRDADAVWLLATHARYSPCKFRQPGPTCDWRDRHLERQRVRESHLVAAPGLSLLPEHAGAAWTRSHIPVRPEASPAARPPALPEEGV